MMGTTMRILILAVLVFVVDLGADWMRAGLKPAVVAKPDRDINDMPLQFGQWQGREYDLAEENKQLYDQIGADVVTERRYRDQYGNEIFLHCAVFLEYDVGVFHLPTNCYRSQGWQLADQQSVYLESPVSEPKTVNLMTSEQEGQQPALACYWYQLGEHVVLSRLDLGVTRWKLGGRETWPPLIKVLITGTLADPEESRRQVHEFAQQIYTWLNTPVDQPDPGEPAEPAATVTPAVAAD